MKNQIEKPIVKIFHTQYLIHEEETMKLIKAYSHLLSESDHIFKRALLELKIQKKKLSSDSPFEDILKMVSTIVPLMAIIATLFIATFKEVDILLTFSKAALDSVTIIFLAIIFTVFCMRIFSVSLSKSNMLIDTHLLIAEDIYEELSQSQRKTSDSDEIIKR